MEGHLALKNEEIKRTKHELADVKTLREKA